MARKLIQDIFVNDKPADIVRKDVSGKKEEPKEDSKKTESNQKKEFFAKRQDFKKIFTERKKGLEVIERYDEPEEKISKNSHIFIWIICIIAVGTLLFFVSSIFSTAVLTITPKSEPVTLNDLFMITTSTSTAQSLDLHYQIETLTETMSQPLTTNGSNNVSVKATGKAIIYNDYSAVTQRLITNTRLETTDGLIYRITEPVDVPGIKTVNGVQTPGSVEVTIVADAPGTQYNMKLTDFKGDFTIPGFEGTPQYSGFYARLSADATGGYVGTAKTVSADVLSAGRTELKNTIQAQLIKDIYSQNPDQDTIFKNDYFVTYTDLPDAADATNYTISESATMYAIAFNKSELAAFIAEDKLPDYDNSPVNAIWNDDMSVTVSGMTATPWLENQLKATFSGDGTIVWSYDSNKILDEIKGQDKSVLSDILNESTSSITQMTASIMPAWDNTFPKNTAKIKIIDSVMDQAQ